MQKFFMLVLIGLSFVFFVGCNEQSNEQKKNKNLCQLINEVHINHSLAIQFFKVKEHDYIMVRGDKYSKSAYAGMVHDPDCKKCNINKTETVLMNK